MRVNHKDKAYWEQKYVTRPEESPVKPGSAYHTSVESKRITKILSSVLEQKVAAFCREFSVTPAVLFEAAVILYLAQINPRNRTITIGVPVLNRGGVKEKRIAGMFVSTMPLTVQVNKEMSVIELAKQIAREHMDIFRHQKYPYAYILKMLREKQNFMGNLYDVMVSYQNAKTETGADTKWYSNGYSEITLTVHIDNRDRNDSHTINVDYQTAVFGHGEAEYLIGRLEYILQQMTEGEGKCIRDIGIIPEMEWKKITQEFNNTAVNYPRDKCVHELFEEQAARTPERVVLVFEDKSFTYRQLDEMSNSLAHFLREKGVGRGEIVPVIAARSWYVIVAILGVLKSGGAYMLIDYQYPIDRIKCLVNECNADIALVYDFELDNAISLDKIDYSKDKTPVEMVNETSDAFCTIHTSGSTGIPKATALTHKNVAHYINYSTELFQGIKQTIAATIITFDAFIQETIVSLCRQIPVILLDELQMTNPLEFEKIINRYEDSFLFQTPTKLQNYIKKSKSKTFLSKIACFVIGGEVFAQEYCERK